MIKIFRYIEKFDFFIIDENYKKISDELGLTEWNEVIWIGRYFILDNDYGEHWFDNWDLREKNKNEIAQLGLDETQVFIVAPERFKNDKDGPCHSDEGRKMFWTDVLKSLEISFDTIVFEAIKMNLENKEYDNDSYIANLEERINEIKLKYFEN